jgi:hypothetical protein
MKSFFSLKCEEMVAILSGLLTNTYNEIDFISVDLIPCTISRTFSPLAYKKSHSLGEDNLWIQWPSNLPILV